MSLSASLTSAILPSRGFHFEYLTDASLLRSIRPDCNLFLLHVLPPDVFVDKYELQERGLEFKLYGELDLERPLIAVDPAGSTLEIKVPVSMTTNIPLHARYPLPSSSMHSMIRVPFPQAYWACYGSKHSGNDPFLHLTSPYYKSLDLNVWSIYFLDANDNINYHVLEVPAGQKADLAFVEFGTSFAIFMAALYIMRAVWRMATQRRVNLKVE